MMGDRKLASAAPPIRGNNQLMVIVGRGGDKRGGRGRARYTTATRCGGFVVAPLLREVTQRLGGEQLLRCADAGGRRDGGVGGVVGSGGDVLNAEGALGPCSRTVVVAVDVVNNR